MSRELSREYTAIVRVRVQQPNAYPMSPIEYLTTHIEDVELGVAVLDVKLDEDSAKPLS